MQDYADTVDVQKKEKDSIKINAPSFGSNGMCVKGFTDGKNFLQKI